MFAVKKKRWIGLFIAVLVIVFAQVAWWTVVFLDDVNVISHLRYENFKLESNHTRDKLAAQALTLEKAASRRRVMFISESLTFVLLSCFGLYLLYRAMHFEAHAREIERNFVEIIGHESKTPITAMKLRLESLIENKGVDKEMVREIELSLVEVRRLSSIFDKAMSVHRLERQVMSFQEVELGELVNEVLRRTGPLLKAHGVKVEFEHSGEHRVLADPFGIENAFQCLVENAVLHNPKDLKELKVSLKTVGGTVLLSVIDNGVEIGLDERDKIFERFYRGKQRSSDRPVSGTGLGLYIAKTILNSHQGDLKLIKSSHEGTEFEMEIPRVT